jgi:hypothetical protein
MGEFDTDLADAHGLWTLYNRIRPRILQFGQSSHLKWSQRSQSGI